ncbi:hypothetical protein [Dokdonella soli]|uniref:DUF1579 domain-containing protein n=1 Tax=Dokdonella soli TaxID=529810 RepID=A0ABN1IDA6_9GAMM
MRHSRWAALLLSTTVCSFASAADAPPSGTAASPPAYDYFLGVWRCDGVFPASGKTISSSMRFEWDLASHSLLKHHDDKPPALYHAVELWSSKANSNQFNAAIVDNFGGVRAFGSPGWQGDSLTWTGAPAVQPRQQFVYTKLGNDRFRVDWQVAKNDQPFVVGDTLTCERKRG